jgi:hypothetical protein
LVWENAYPGRMKRTAGQRAGSKNFFIAFRFADGLVNWNIRLTNCFVDGKFM